MTGYADKRNWVPWPDAVSEIADAHFDGDIDGAENDLIQAAKDQAIVVYNDLPERMTPVERKFWHVYGKSSARHNKFVIKKSDLNRIYDFRTEKDEARKSEDPDVVRQGKEPEAWDRVSSLSQIRF